MSLVKKLAGQINEDEYLEGELTSQVKHEYMNGHVYAMTGATKKHNLICMNVSSHLYTDLKKNNSPCNVFSSDILEKVNIGKPLFIF